MFLQVQVTMHKEQVVQVEVDKGPIIQTFCGSGSSRGVHDQYYYNRPVEIVSGKISVPRFNLANTTLI
jgi:hypothetical protein